MSNEIQMSHFFQHFRKLSQKLGRLEMQIKILIVSSYLKAKSTRPFRVERLHQLCSVDQLSQLKYSNALKLPSKTIFF